MKRILTTFSEKWPEYFIEAVVIIASILGAIGLENWNENRKQRNDLIKDLERIAVDLKADLQNLSNNISKGGEVNTYWSSLLDSGKSQNSSEGFLGIIGAPGLYVTESGYISARDRGSLAAIKNERLKQKIVHYYEVNYDNIVGTSDEMNRQATILSEAAMNMALNNSEDPEWSVDEVFFHDAFQDLFQTYFDYSLRVTNELKARRLINQEIDSLIQVELKGER